MPNHLEDHKKPRRTLYAIIDKLAQDVPARLITIGQHEAVAIREFAEVVLADKSRLAMHPNDFALVQLGYIIDETLALESSYNEIITAAQVIALAQAQRANDNRQEG